MMQFKPFNFSNIRHYLIEFQSLPYIAVIPALFYLLYVVTSSSNQLVNSSTQIHDSVVEPEQITQASLENKQMNFLTIKDWHLFGQLDTTVIQNSEPQKTQLQIKLLGVFFLPNQKKSSFAIIEGEDKLQKKYRLGEELPGGVTLQAIDKEQVILLRNQQPEFLSMDKTKTGLLFITK
jgi:general secretion pathway protein C